MKDIFTVETITLFSAMSLLAVFAYSVIPQAKTFWGVVILLTANNCDQRLRVKLKDRRCK